MNPINSRLPRGVLTISLDFELVWGTLDLFGPNAFRRTCEAERAAVERLLELFVEFEIPATWCILGHLFLDACAAGPFGKHPEIVRPSHAWCQRDWFEHDPCCNEATHPTFYAQKLVEKIRDCPCPQEIGSHSFSHVIFGDQGCSRETAQSELAACVALANAWGIEMTSFAFPRNQIGHLDVLQDFGFYCYRGPEPHWYNRTLRSGFLRRLAHLADVLLAAEPPTVMPSVDANGMWNVPGSMIYFPMHGFRKWIPMFLRVKRATKGLNAAARKKEVFHLWFHPTNLGDHTEAMFRGLRSILEHAANLRDRGNLDVLPMRALVPHNRSTNVVQAPCCPEQ
jgi:peptidoglycan/xylan/chitin deacetylase (PgdA/CDA1 family)